MNHILVPIDGSEQAWKALNFAFERYSGDRITVLNVVDPAAGFYTDFDGGYYDQALFEQAMDRGESLCTQARDRLEERDLHTETVLETAVESGRPARTILEFVEEHAVDHVVLGSRGRSGVSRVLLGSVAERVARRAPVPVTIVR